MLLLFFHALSSEIVEILTMSMCVSELAPQKLCVENASEFQAFKTQPNNSISV